MRAMGLALALIAGCVGESDHENCHAASCAGCCTPDGRCLDSTGDTLCGINGAQCADCSAQGAICDSAMSQCVPKSGPGGPCADNRQCQSNRCSLNWPNGTCLVNGPSDCVAVNGFYVQVDGPLYTCILPCSPSGGCRPGYVCIQGQPPTLRFCGPTETR